MRLYLRIVISALIILCFIFGTNVASKPLDLKNQESSATKPDNFTISPPFSTGSRFSNEATSNGAFGFCEIGGFNFSSFGGSDCWGWEAPDGTEYAIMGIHDGIVFVNVTTMQVVDQVSGPTLGCSGVRWRDMVTYQNYCYAVSECSGTNEGMMIIDMQYLPDSVHLIDSYIDGNNVTSHNMSIDTATGFAYVCFSAGNGFRIIDLADPENPVDVNGVSTIDIHDLFARNDTVWVSEGGRSSFSIWDVADKMNPQLITRISIPSGGYSHNIWPTGDGRHCATTEETAGKTIKIWNIEDLQNVQLVGELLGGSQLAHNAHFVGDTLYVSHYESGIIVAEISDPTQPNLLAQFDTWTSGENPSFDGAWGVFPHTSSGKVYVSNDYGRLNILEPVIISIDGGVVGDSIISNAGTKVRVDVSMDNETPIKRITLPFRWGGDLNLILDSVSTFGLRTAYWEEWLWMVYDPGNKRQAIRFGAGPTQADLPPGTGPVISIYLTIPFGASGNPNEISFAPINATEAEVLTDCFEFEPTVTSGWVALPNVNNNCCVGVVGNVDNQPGENVDIGDLTALIDYLFISQTPPVCEEEANIDGDINGNIDIGDITSLIDFLFIGNITTLNDCP